MASQPLIDLGSIDLDRVLASREEILTRLKHREHFVMLDGVLHRGVEAGIIVGYKEIRADDWWAAGHIPGRPIFPGVLMIESGAQLCSYDFLLRAGDEERFIGFAGLNGTRFRGVVEPDCRMLFVGKLHRIRSTMFSYLCQGLVDGKLVFETEVLGVAL
jgi:3-hydroxyacyl-[acyl-carrier-protein] dehydratase